VYDLIMDLIISYLPDLGNRFGFCVYPH